jgi:hypothetical protein
MIERKTIPLLRRWFATLRVASIACVLFLLLAQASAQSGQREAAPGAPAVDPESANGLISGVVLSDEGRPLLDAQITIRAVRDSRTFDSGRTVPVQPNGSFRFGELRRGAYALFPASPGYVSPDVELAPGRRPRYYTGANVALTMVKGGVITGQVSDITGSPLIAVRVRAMRVRDGQGRKLQSSPFMTESPTDDRGIYRIYGLPAGSYIVAVGSIEGRGGLISGGSDLLDGAPTYFPSASADTATEVNVAPGQEVSGIDLRVRGETGHTISGMLVGAVKPAEGRSFGIVTMLMRAGNGMYLSNAFVQENNGEFAFSFTDVPDGDYLLRAERSGQNDNAASALVPVRIRRADVGGIRVMLNALGSVSGNVIVERDPALKDRAECASEGRVAVAEEFSLRLRRDGQSAQDVIENAMTTRETSPDPQGSFQAERLLAGTYWLVFNFPDERSFVRSVARTGPNGKLVDAGRARFALGPGERLTGVAVTMTDGATGLSGRLAAAGEKESLPPRSLVHLVPAEPDAADAVLRYREVEVASDGVFALANIAPGKYWVYAVELPVSDVRENFRRPVAWDAAARLKLHRAAEASKQSVELKPCQRITDQVVRVAVPGK